VNRVFVTGGTGFIGRRLLQVATAQGMTCHALVRRSSDVRPLQLPGVDLVYGAIDRPETYREALQKCDLVIHLAGLTHAASRGELFRINADACGLLGDACIEAGVKRLVYVSSLAAAGPPPMGKTIRDEFDSDSPVSDYGRSKLGGEVEFRKRADLLRTTVIRPGVVYGPGDPKFSQLVDAVVRWHIHFVVGFKTPDLSLIHVDDLVRLIFSASRQGEYLLPASDERAARAQGVYFAGDDSEFVSYANLGKRIARAANTRVFVFPIWTITGMTIALVSEVIHRIVGKASILNRDKIREAAASSWACSSQKARHQLDFSPARPLGDSLPEVVATYLK
jgi:nucleoside-diphosphate-sugar epimerase